MKLILNYKKAYFHGGIMEVDNNDKLNAINEHIIKELKTIDEQESKKLNLKTEINLKPSAKPNK